MPTVTLAEAKAHLETLIARLAPQEELLITDGARPIARLRSAEPTTRRARPPRTGVPKLGRWAGQFVVPTDFDEPLPELREYME